MERRTLLGALLGGCIAPAYAKVVAASPATVMAEPHEVAMQMPKGWDDALSLQGGYSVNGEFFPEVELDFVKRTRTDFRTNPPTVTALRG